MRERSLLTFIIVTLLIALPAVLAVWRMDQLPLHLAMNRYHSPGLDMALTHITQVASGWVPALLALLMLLKSWRAFLMMGVTSALSAMLVQALKHLAFPLVARPLAFLQSMPGLQLVEGEELHRYFSFPSGHSTAAFAMCIGLAVVIGKQGPAAILAVLASIMAYSRVYLSQHFTEDILAGAFVGSLTGVVVYAALYRGKWAHQVGLDRSPILCQNQ